MRRTKRDGIAEQVLQEVELGADDSARLADLHTRLAPQLGEIAQRFVDRVVARGDAVGATSTKQSQLRSTLVEWMDSGLAGPHDQHFFERHTSLAIWHAAAGLSPRHAIVAVNLTRQAYHDQIAQLYDQRAGRLVAMSVDKLLDVELASLAHEPRDASAEATEREHRAQSQRITAMQTLSTGLAHEVRNPLNSASLQLELLERRLRRTAADPRLMQPVEQVSRELERLGRMLDEFLAFAQPSRVVLADHDVSDIVRDVVAAQQSLATVRHAELRLTGNATLRARVDADKVAQISRNLIRNALEAVEPGGHVVVTIAHDDDNVRLAIEDDGPGIATAIQSRIYEPFFTTRETGTGLGLSIVHGMVAVHGGTIAFASSPRGTRFEVSLPRRPRQTDTHSA